MKVYIAKYPSLNPLMLDSEMNYDKPEIRSEYPVAFFDRKIMKGDMILFYQTFVDEKGNESEVIFAYFQVGKVKSGFLLPFEKLSFDSERRGMGVLCIRRLSFGTSIAPTFVANTLTSGVIANEMTPASKNAAISITMFTSMFEIIITPLRKAGSCLFSPVFFCFRKDGSFY